MKNNKQGQLKSWAKKTIDIYVNLANEPLNNLAFYQQTPLTGITDDVKIVVLGINPGSGGTYSDQKTNPSWEMNGKDATAMHLLKGNFPSWNEHNNWQFIKNLCRLLEMSQLDDKEVVVTNETFFSTAKAREINRKLISDTIECSLNLIDILNPQIILCLSSKACFDRIKEKHRDEFESVDVYGNALKLGLLGGRVYVGIYHPAYYYSSQLTELIRKAIRIVQEHTGESLETIKSILLNECKPQYEAYIDCSKSSGNWKDKAADTCELIFQSNGFLPYIEVEHESSDKYGNLIIRINRRIYAKFVVQSNKQYISWMHSDYETKPYNVSLQKYALTDEVSKILDRYGFDNHRFELGRKDLRSYGSLDENELSKQVISDINSIAEEINALLRSKNVD